MKAKIFSSLSFVVLFLLVLTSFASATPSFSGVPSSLSTLEGYHEYNITLANATDVITSLVTITEGTSFDVTISFNSTTNISTVSYTVPTGFEFEFEKEYSFSITANDSLTSTSASQKLTFEENTNWYDGDNEGELNVYDMELDVSSGFGDEDNYWYPFDEAQIKFTVENNGEYDIENIKIEVCVFDEDKGKCVFDEDDMDLSTDEFDLDSGDDQDVKITFTVDGDNLKSGDTDYTIYVRAVGKLTGDDAEDDDVDGDKTGDSEYQEITIYTDDEFVIISNIQFNSDSVSCGDEIELTADVWNVGDSDLDDDEVYVRAYNKELGIDKVFEFDNGIDAMESESITLSLSIEDVKAGNYLIKLTAYDDEDMEDDDVFETRHDEDKSIFYAELKVDDSCSVSSVPTAVVSASLQSEAKAGKDLIVKATITNTGSESKTFLVSASSYTDWASSASLDKTSITLAAGQSTDVLVTLKVLSSSEGENGFDIELVEGSKFLSQPVPVTIEKSSSFPNITGFVSGFGDNAYLYGILALNLILIAGIVFVAIKLVRKKSQ